MLQTIVNTIVLGAGVLFLCFFVFLATLRFIDWKWPNYWRNFWR